MTLNLPKPILYLITRGETGETTSRESPEFQEILFQVSAAAPAGIQLVQLREKKLTARALFELTECAVKTTRGTATRVLVNDRADIAAGAGADGVHLTTQSLSVNAIRETFGENFLIGVSTHSLKEVREARDSGANFAVFGPVFPSPLKEKYGPPLGLEQLSEVARELPQFPVLALGGVSIENAEECLRAGASGIAGISLFSEPDSLMTKVETIRKHSTGVAK
jgi:thiamine-phosphate pyrophosphorylase